MDKRDFLKECNDRGVPVADFTMAFCDRCYQPECTRSLFGKTHFDQRVATWVERLFTEVPRMDPKDPRFMGITEKKFFLVEPPLPGKMSSWNDPRDLKSSVQVPASLELTPTPPQEVEETKPEPPPRTESANLSQEVVLINTPNQGGVMLRGAPPPTLKGPARDQWDAPTPLAPSETLVKRGATIRFGSGVQGEAPPKEE